MEPVVEESNIESILGDYIVRENRLASDIDRVLKIANELREYGLWSPIDKWNAGSRVNLVSGEGNEFTGLIWGNYIYTPVDKKTFGKRGIIIKGISKAKDARDELYVCQTYDISSFLPVFSDFQKEFYEEANRIVKNINI